jgi:ketosteroid isomerase-like protein
VNKFLYIALCALCCAPSWAQTKTELAAIQKLERTDAAAAKINDVETLTSLWSEDGVLIQPATPPVVGRPAIHDTLAKQKEMSSKVEVVAYDEDWQDRQISRDHAFEWGTISVTLRLPDAREITQRVYAGRYLSKSSDGVWRFARVVITPAEKR